MFDASRLQSLIDEYGSLRRLEGHTAQSRGRRFNEVIAEVLRCWRIDAKVSLRSAGEIDVAFAASGVRYVLEAKWESRKTDTGQVAKLQKRVRQRLAGTYGIFLSMAGYSDEAIADVAHGERLEVLLLDADHFEAMLSGLVPPLEMLSLVHDRAAFLGEAHTPLLTLLASMEAPPQVEFGALDPPGSPLLRSAVPGVSGEVLFRVADSRQLGLAGVDRDRLLVTTQPGIIEVDLKARQVHWAVPVPGCHRNPLVDDDGGIIFARRHGVGRLRRGRLSVIGGGFPGATCLLRHPDGRSWVFSNGDVDGRASASITKLGTQLGDEVRHGLDYPPASAFNAVWVTDAEVLTIGNPWLQITSLATGEIRRHNAAQTNPMGAVSLGAHTVLTAGDDTTLGRTDLGTGDYHQLAQLALPGSVNELAHSPYGDVYIAAYCQSNTDQMPFAVARIVLPPQVWSAASRAAPAAGAATAASGHPRAPTDNSVSATSRAVRDAVPRRSGGRPPRVPVAPSPVPWNISRPDRGNEEGAYVTFAARRRVYWVIVGLNLPLILVLSIIVAAPETSVAGRIMAGTVGIFVLVLTVGFFQMAKSPVRLEIGAQGVQVFARSETSWIPWEVIDRIDVVRVQGNQHLVAWCRGANMFPEFDTFGGGPRFLSELGAIAICPLNVLRGRRHQIVRALHAYGGGRATAPAPQSGSGPVVHSSSVPGGARAPEGQTKPSASGASMLQQEVITALETVSGLQARQTGSYVAVGAPLTWTFVEQHGTRLRLRFRVGHRSPTAGAVARRLNQHGVDAEVVVVRNPPERNTRLQVYVESPPHLKTLSGELPTLLNEYRLCGERR